MTARSRQARRAQAQQLKAQRRALRALLQQRRQEARAALKARRAALAEARAPQAAQAQRRRRRQRLLVLLLLLLLLLSMLPDCSCRPPPPPPDGAGGPEVTAPAGAATPAPVPAPLPTERIPKKSRPAYENPTPAPLPWIASFRLQVAARSPRLAACFVGMQRPGALKWTTSVEPSRGHVSDHVLEPMLLSEDLTQTQRACVLGVLSAPPYQLEAEEARATPSRVSLVIEF